MCGAHPDSAEQQLGPESNFYISFFLLYNSKFRVIKVEISSYKVEKTKYKSLNVAKSKYIRMFVK